MSIKNREWAVRECKSPFPSDRHVLLAMADHTDDKNLCWLSVSSDHARDGPLRRGVQYARGRLEIVGTSRASMSTPSGARASTD